MQFARVCPRKSSLDQRPRQYSMSANNVVKSTIIVGNTFTTHCFAQLCCTIWESKFMSRSEVTRSMAARMLISRLVLCETDHASGTGEIRGCVLWASDDTAILPEWAMMSWSVVWTSLSIRSRNTGCAENEGSVNPHMQCVRKNKY